MKVIYFFIFGLFSFSTLWFRPFVTLFFHYEPKNLFISHFRFEIRKKFLKFRKNWFWGPKKWFKSQKMVVSISNPPMDDIFSKILTKFFILARIYFVLTNYRFFTLRVPFGRSNLKNTHLFKLSSLSTTGPI